MGELLDPLATIERELREELLVFEPKAGRRYVFSWNEGQPSNHPDFAIARRVWEEIFHRRNFPALEERSMPLKWLMGPDSVRIKFDGQPPILVKDVILNINAEDFGIEIDRIAKIEIGPDAIPCDGEIVRGRLLNRVIGLFNVREFNNQLTALKSDFRPQLVFHNGKDVTKQGVDWAIKNYLRDLVKEKPRSADAPPISQKVPKSLGLCPVTRNVIRRYLLLGGDQVSPPIRSNTKADVFISFAGEARQLAGKAYDYLRKRGYEVFFSDETLHQTNFSSAIDNALEAARAMVVVGTHSDHFRKPWVEYEWQSFHVAILNRKKTNAALMTLAGDVDPFSLPNPLGMRHVEPCNPSRPRTALQSIERFLP